MPTFHTVWLISRLATHFDVANKVALRSNPKWKVMAFKTNTFSQNAATNPAAHFKTLTKRQYPDVMPHQKDILENYAASFQNLPDVALQLPTGSGKTLVGLLIADWRRVTRKDRVLYLCPTKQLVHQTVQQARTRYGIDVVDLSGRKDQFPPADSTAYMTGAQVAISTYSGLFNTHPFFTDPDVIIIDDAHAAENYIAEMWSLMIDANTPLHAALSEFLRPHIDPQDHSRLTGDWMGTSDATWVDKLPSPLLASLAYDLISVIDAHATRQEPELFFPWSMLRSHLEACHVYLGSREILIRPLIPPTSTHAPFAKASHRIYMSATLGAGGDLERLTGRKKIGRLAAPEGFQSSGVGRRFFMFPSLSLTGDDTDTLRLNLQKRAGRSVTLTPSQPQADAIANQVTTKLQGFVLFTKSDIEIDKTSFISTPNAAAVLANRYDGIDFPGDECRLLCVDGLPRAMNSQERFIMSKMAAAVLFNERIQTRVLQAAGRCTRALQDRSAVFVTGTELVDFLADSRKWKHFHPELQAELSFGVLQSTDTPIDSFQENFNMFMENSHQWASADATIRNDAANFQRSPYPAMDELEKVVEHEVTYQEAMWNKDYGAALTAARTILSDLKQPDLRGYRALWHYLAGSAALRLSTAAGDAQSLAAREQFAAARAAAPSVSWLNGLTSPSSTSAAPGSEPESSEIHTQVEAIEKQFLAMGTATNAKFEKTVAKVLKELAQPHTFEAGQVGLGTVLGFIAGNDETDAAPDPWWLGRKLGLVFESHADGHVSTVFGAVKARQASSHPKWIKKNVHGSEDMDVFPVLVTPCVKAKSGADPHLDDVRYWELSHFRNWANHAIGILRGLKGTFPGEGDLLWRAEAYQHIRDGGLGLEALSRGLPSAAEAMEIVP